MTRIIALCGRAGAGKSTAAQVLTNDFGFELVRLADPLKNMLRVLGLGDRELYGDLKETRSDLLCGKSSRFAQQTLGTEWGRNLIGENIWVNAWAREAQGLLGEGYAVVTDDLRFPNEEAQIRHMGGNIVKITRPGAEAKTGVAGHASEAYEASADLTIENDGLTLASFQDKVQVAIQQLLGGS